MGEIPCVEVVAMNQIVQKPIDRCMHVAAGLVPQVFHNNLTYICKIQGEL